MQGHVVSINIATENSGPMQAVPEIRAVAGKGLEGDRYFASDKEGGGRHATLIELEAIEALEREHGLKLSPGDARRNIVTRGVAINDLLGREFLVGAVRMLGVKLSEPCAHLASLTDEKVLKGLVHRGGLRADILSDGMIRPGDVVADT